MKTYDIIVVGGGGGTKLVSPVAKMGLKVAVIEKEALGGTCLNRGCIPSKMLIHPADVAHEIDESHKLSIEVDTNYKVKWKELVEFVSTSVDGVSKNIETNYIENENIDFYDGEATFVSDKVIEVGGEKLTAPKIIIAVGARSSVPNIPGLLGTPFMTSKEALRNTKQPKKMIVLGGGYIGVELGHFYGGLGTEVEFVVRSGFIGNEDWQVREEFTRVFSERYKTHFNVETKSVSHEGDTFFVTIADRDSGEEMILRGDALLVAVGIVPNNDTLNLENTGIILDKKGFVETNRQLMTNVEGVYAIGDCNGRYFFRHSVNFEGEWLFDALFSHPHQRAIDYPPMPHAIFSNPQIGGVGVTEDELKESGKCEGSDYVVGLNFYKNSAMGDALRSDYGFVKLIFDVGSKKLIGAHIIGPEASNMIHMCVAQITMGATLDDMLWMIYVHPALPENVRNAARKARDKFLEMGRVEDVCE